jgi:mannose-6-phosphate isomerase-like protein (cupin superfamily)
MSQTTRQPTRPASQPFVAGPDDGEHVWFLATRMTIKATAQTTAGALGVVEVRAAPGFSPPLHIHHHEDEAFWLLEGALTLLCDGQLFEATTGHSSGCPATDRTRSGSRVTRPSVCWS